MRKRQAEEYFLQLKKIDHDKSIKMAELINILTGGVIGVREFYQFTDYLKSNEFGEYGHIDENIDKQDWRQLDFSTVHQLLKAIRDFVSRISKEKNKETSLTISEHKEEGTLVQENSIMMDLFNGSVLQDDPMSAREREEKKYEEKWKNYKLRILKKLLIIFDYYRKTIHNREGTFELKQQLSHRIDITTFMRYFKEFELSPAFEKQLVIRVFKANGINTLWLDFDRFVSVHLHLIGFQGELSHQERCLKLKGLNEMLSPDKMQRMLNIRREHIVTTVEGVEGHTGAYKEDIIAHLQQKSLQRKQKLSKKWSGKALKTENSPQQEINNFRKSRISSMKNLPRAKTEAAPSVYQELKLPKLRLKEFRQESVYRSLNKIQLGHQQEKIKELVGMESEEYLEQYLQQQSRLREKSKAKPKSKEVLLPRMKFT